MKLEDSDDVHAEADEGTAQESEDPDVITGAGYFECGVCHVRFIRLSLLEKHLNKHREAAEGFKCEICGKTFSRSLYLLMHGKVHGIVYSGVKSYTCEICSLSFTSSNGLVSHRRIHTRETTYKCVLCANIFHTYTCDFCDQIYSSHRDLVTHRRLHVGEIPHTIHTGDISFTCDACAILADTCSASVTSKLNTQESKGSFSNIQHRNKASSNSMTSHQSKICDSKDSSSSNIQHSNKPSSNTQQDIRTSSNSNARDMYKCIHCDALVAYEQTLEHHKQVHGTMTLHQCNICGKQFTHRFILSGHMPMLTTVK